MEKILKDSKAVVYDPYKAKHILKKLEDDGYENSIPLRQGFISLTSPTKFLLDLVKQGNLVHEDDPVLNWMVSNLSIIIDAAGNIKPDKSDINRKIDAVAALINALSYFEASQEEKSVYEVRGLRKL